MKAQAILLKINNEKRRVREKVDKANLKGDDKRIADVVLSIKIETLEFCENLILNN